MFQRFVGNLVAVVLCSTLGHVAATPLLRRTTSGAKVGTVIRLRLMNADTDLPIAGYDPLPAVSNIDLNALPTENLSVEAWTQGDVASVQWTFLNVMRVENAKPWLMCSNNGPNVFACRRLVAGFNSTIVATPFNSDNAQGSRGVSASIALTLYRGPTSPQASDAPTKAPDAPVKAPDAPIKVPEAPTKAPMTPIKAPVAPIKSPVAPTKAPDAPTKAPVTPIQSPVAPTKPPVAPAKAPVAPVKSPVAPTKAPVAPIKSPDAPTKAPTKAPLAPTDTTLPEVLGITLLSASTVDVTNGPALLRFQIVAQDKGGSGLATGWLTLDGEPQFMTALFRFPPTKDLRSTVNVSVTVPQASAPGEYRFLQLWVADNADNAKFYNTPELTTPNITVVNANYDGTSPGLTSFSALTPLTVNVSTRPATVTFQVNVKDVSGIEGSTLRLIHPTTFDTVASTSFSRTKRGTNVMESFNVTLAIPKFVKEGDYRLSLDLKDDEGNSMFYYTDLLDALNFPSVVQVTNRFVDATPPKLLNMMAISPEPLNITSGPVTAQYQLTVQDGEAGILSARVALRSRSQLELFPDQPVPDAVGAPVTVTSSYEFGQRQQSQLSSLEVVIVDKAFNTVTYSAADLARLGFPSSLQIINSRRDVEPPSLVNVVALSPTTVDVTLQPATFELQVVAQDDISGFKNGTVSLLDRVNHFAVSSAVFSSVPSPSTPLAFNTTLPIPRYLPSGLYDVDITLADAESNVLTRFLVDSYMSIEIVNRNEDVVAPQLLTFTTLAPPTGNATTGMTTVKFQVSASDVLSGVKQVVVSLKGPYYDVSQTFAVESPVGGTQTFNGELMLPGNLKWSDLYLFDVSLIDAAANLAQFASYELLELGFSGTL